MIIGSEIQDSFSRGLHQMQTRLLRYKKYIDLTFSSNIAQGVRELGGKGKTAAVEIPI